MKFQCSPGQLLTGLLHEANLSIGQFAEMSGIEHRELSEILDDSRQISDAYAGLIGKIFYSPGFWSVRQAIWQLQNRGYYEADRKAGGHA